MDKKKSRCLPRKSSNTPMVTWILMPRSKGKRSTTIMLVGERQARERGPLARPRVPLPRFQDVQLVSFLLSGTLNSGGVSEMRWVRILKMKHNQRRTLDYLCSLRFMVKIFTFPDDHPRPYFTRLRGGSSFISFRSFMFHSFVLYGIERFHVHANMSPVMQARQQSVYTNDLYKYAVQQTN